MPLTLIDVSFSGARNNGPKLAARCPTHGIVYVETPFQLEGAHVFVSRSSTKCPICGQRIPLADGYYDFSSWVAERLYDKALSRQQIRRFQRKVTKTKDPNSLELSARNISPELGDVVAEAQNTGKWNLSWEKSIVITAAVVTILAGADQAFTNAKDAASWVAERLKQSEGSNIEGQPVEEGKNKNQTENENPQNDTATGGNKNLGQSWPKPSDI